jgi:uncharacterized protein YodC (DUF2158 family)
MKFLGSFNKVIIIFVVVDSYSLLILRHTFTDAMEKKFVMGDIVLMIADGPRMVVEGYVVDEDPPGQFTESNEFVNVVYFAGDSFKRETFHQDLLIFADEG